MHICTKFVISRKGGAIINYDYVVAQIIGADIALIGFVLVIGMLFLERVIKQLDESAKKYGVSCTPC